MDRRYPESWETVPAPDRRDAAAGKEGRAAIGRWGHRNQFRSQDESAASVRTQPFAGTGLI
jgi:hypothetical protein